MPATNWKTIWKSPVSMFRDKKEATHVSRLYLKQHKKNKQIRLIQWLKNCITQKTSYANIPIGCLLIDLRKTIESMGKRIRKRGRSGTV